VAAANAAAYFAMFQPALTDVLRTTAMSLAYGILPLCHLIVPVVGGPQGERVGRIFNASLPLA